ncbi:MULTISPECIES: HlyD family type I secretion periplasmic adaptor subunit [Vibrio]|uniref:Membrane fusion protein (MFP) family protein n=6 Tax=Vibrio TaxID=662 RepID=A0A7Z1MF24_9VIBR|nr:MULTISPECIES: HlyD family type I secretion periplasmic adaptor subunit [Vibrio]KNH11448.1 hemolysin secretion protein D [Vibrio lentus]MBY7659376.1 HlyD family type I secretion periplasmic adaptor subunit [Vibrio atlanticus]ERM58389.1 ABC-type protease exporter, membrane fusion protein (MFP) family component PrtE/AprE [Vibrio cyclitrophicus FF75]KAA8602805.1 Type I secretion system membrane fusion protein LapC [Vibrio cyclitrophicus]MBE8558322.1 HlyD family type I secretion periplasmic adap|tara:strand:- start:9611 stop:11002 length:1392 start_codon:yes stop_codon:yes gene_type:complete
MSQKNFSKLNETELEYVDDKTAALLLNTPTSARIMLWVIVLFFIAAIGWSAWAEIDKVTVGQGKVIPSSQIQVVQNLEGGLVKEILVREGQQVQKGQQLLLIDDTRFRSDFREREQQVANLTANVLMLSASFNSVVINEEFSVENWKKSVLLDYGKLAFPPALYELQPKLVNRQKAEYRQDLNNLKNQLSVFDQQVEQKQQDLIEIKARVDNLRQSYKFARQELDITKPLADEGVVPRIELLKLQRQVNDTRRELTSSELKIPLLRSAIKEAMLSRIDAALSFRSEQQEKLNQAQDKLSAMTESSVGLEDRVNRTVVVSPVTGTVKTLGINTVGGVIQPGMDIVEIVPTEDSLLVEAKIAPQDIAFLRPELPAIVKFSAYDFTKYGGLEGVLEHISADTTQDEEGNSYYIVRVRTEKYSFGHNEELPIIPGMTASVDIITGKRTVLEYMLKPILSAQNNALKE